MTSQHAILAVALHAAFADGAKHDREREAIRRIADSLAGEAGAPDLARLYQDVLLKRTSLEQAIAALDRPELRQLAYEMAVCVCNADGRESEMEQAFLAGLKSRLALDAISAQRIESEAGAVAEFSESAAAKAPAAPPAMASQAPAPAPTTRGAVSEAGLDQSILNHALIAGALELLPQSWASMAIIPLQMKLVHGIGKAHGYALDQGHIKEFLATAGVGLTSQYLERFGRKLLGGLLGKAAGRTFGHAGGAATGMAFSFASTWALGQVARRYYAGGRIMSAALLRESFQSLLGPARQMQAKYLPQIEQQSRTLDIGQIMNLVRGR
ncbi:MAG: DUF533 domain-containing protein [Elusimicrobiota bacterium]